MSITEEGPGSARGRVADGDDCAVLDVPLHVQREVVTPREAAVTMTTFEGFGAGVLPIVAGQLVTAGEAPATTFPLALVRLFSWNRDKQLLECPGVTVPNTNTKIQR